MGTFRAAPRPAPPLPERSSLPDGPGGSGQQIPERIPSRRLAEAGDPPTTSTNSPRPSYQEYVRATIHLAGPVTVETGRLAHYSAVHTRARIGGEIIYFLDLVDVDAFIASVAQAARYGAARYSPAHHLSLAKELITNTRGGPWSGARSPRVAGPIDWSEWCDQARVPDVSDV